MLFAYEFCDATDAKHLTLRAPRDKRGVVGRRIDPARRVFDDGDPNRTARLKHPQLLELFRLFERRGRQRGNFEQRIAPVRVNAKVLE